LHDLADRLRKARIDDDYVETDLRQWTTRLQELKNDTTGIQPTITVYEDSPITLVSKLSIASMIQQSSHDESLVKVSGNVRIDDIGRTASQCGSDGNSYVCGVKEYSSGKYKIRFTVNKKDMHCLTCFGIVSKTEPFSKELSSYYGWSSDDICYYGGKNSDNDIDNVSDMRGRTSFTIELLLDCDNRKIQYFNEQTKANRELTINLNTCPFPWKLFFFLYGIGDSVQLL
jgi:hypothetical protein